MSMNITLEGKRILTTQSGRKVVDKKHIERIRQTPTKVTYEILNKPTFEEKLNAYCEWEEEYCVNDEPFYSRVYKYEEDMLEFYKNYNNSDYLCEYETEEEVYKDIRVEYVDKIIMRGEEGFSKIVEDEDFEVDIIAVVALKPRPAREVLDLIIQDMRENEYELEWGMI